MMAFIIAEAACTWRMGGAVVTALEYDVLRELADAVKDAGADALKIQWCSDGAEMGRRRNLSDTYPLLQFDKEFLKTFHDLCVDRELEPMCTVYLPQDVAVIASLFQRYKIASLEACSVSLREAYRNASSRETYVSTGCMDRYDFERCLALWYMPWVKFLHCVAAYPPPLYQMNLARANPQLWMSGLSDHTGSLIAGAVAVGCGLTIIEKHVRPSGCDPRNQDFTHSLTPQSFRQYVNNVREAELLCGKDEKIIQPCEQPLKSHRVTI